MKALSVVGTLAMFLVGGQILTHGIYAVHHWVEHLTTTLNNGFLQTIIPMLLNGVFGIAAGVVALLVINLAKRLLAKPLNKY